MDINIIINAIAKSELSPTDSLYLKKIFCKAFHIYLDYVSKSEDLPENVIFTIKDHNIRQTKIFEQLGIAIEGSTYREALQRVPGYRDPFSGTVSRLCSEVSKTKVTFPAVLFGSVDSIISVLESYHAPEQPKSFEQPVPRRAWKK